MKKYFCVALAIAVLLSACDDGVPRVEDPYNPVDANDNPIMDNESLLYGEGRVEPGDKKGPLPIKGQDATPEEAPQGLRPGEELLYQGIEYGDPSLSTQMKVPSQTLTKITRADVDNKAGYKSVEILGQTALDFLHNATQEEAIDLPRADNPAGVWRDDKYVYAKVLGYDTPLRKQLVTFKTSTVGAVSLDRFRQSLQAIYGLDDPVVASQRIAELKTQASNIVLDRRKQITDSLRGRYRIDDLEQALSRNEQMDRNKSMLASAGLNVDSQITKTLRGQLDTMQARLYQMQRKGASASAINSAQNQLNDLELNLAKSQEADRENRRTNISLAGVDSKTTAGIRKQLEEARTAMDKEIDKLLQTDKAISSMKIELDSALKALEKAERF